MRMSAASSPVGPEGPHRLITATSAGVFPSPPRADPIEMQIALCEAIARLVRDGEPEIVQLDALFALERQAQPVTQLLLAQYVEGDAQIGSFEWKAWHSALRLSQSLFQANEHFLRHIRNTTEDNWTQHESLVQVQLFHHRNAEFLLRFLRYKKRSSELWRQLHEMYRLARERDAMSRPGAIGESGGKRRTMRKLEQQYLQILLLEAMNGGQFSPREGLWAHRWFARWSGGPGLQLAHVNGRAHFEPKGFVVDLDSSDGLKRALVAGGKLLYFDSSPLSAMIDQEIESLQDGNTQEVTPAVRAGQLALLSRLSILFAPSPVNIERRSERKPVALTVQAIAGFPRIVEELWKSAQKQSDGLSSIAPESEQSITSRDVPSFSPVFASVGDADPISLSISNPFDELPQIWQVKDRSASGCRMRAQIDNLNLVVPGSLIAIRESESAPWIVSVVRWFRRLMVDYVEIGVEYLGREPSFIKLVANDEIDSTIGESSDRSSRCFAALYLPPSAAHPTMPIKTLLFPAREFGIGCDVTLLASNATHRLRLNEPIQHRFEYLWTPFSVIDKAAPSP